MYSKQDIAAMKLSAIAGRGSKKVFIDLFFLMQDFSLKEMLAFYDAKFSDGSIFMVLKSLSFFDDADLQQQPKMFVDFDWEDCKKSILNQLKLI